MPYETTLDEAQALRSEVSNLRSRITRVKEIASGALGGSYAEAPGKFHQIINVCSEKD